MKTDARKIRGKKGKAGTNPCSACRAICCRYVAIQIDKPTTPGDFDDIRWYIAHRGVWVFVDDGDWYICIERRCSYLAKDNSCRVYDARPRICRKYRTRTCELNGTGEAYDLRFDRPDQIRRYAKDYFRQKRARDRARYRRLRVRCGL
jgi:uncharacterized protein